MPRPTAELLGVHDHGPFVHYHYATENPSSLLVVETLTKEKVEELFVSPDFLGSIQVYETDRIGVVVQGPLHGTNFNADPNPDSALMELFDAMERYTDGEGGSLI